MNHRYVAFIIGFFTSPAALGAGLGPCWDLKMTIDRGTAPNPAEAELTPALEGHRSRMQFMRVNPSNPSQYLSIDAGGSMKLWDFATRKEVWDRNLQNEKLPFNEHFPDIYAADISKDGKTIAFSSTRSGVAVVGLMNAADGRIIRIFESPTMPAIGGISAGGKNFPSYISSVALSADGRIATGADNYTNRLVFWDTESGKITRQVDGVGDGTHTTYISERADSVLAIGDRSVTIYPTSPRGEPRSLEVINNGLSNQLSIEPTNRFRPFRFADSPLHIVASDVSADFRFVAISVQPAHGNQKGFVFIYDMELLKVVHAAQTSEAHSLRLSGDMRFLATADKEATGWELWDITGGKLIQRRKRPFKYDNGKWIRSGRAGGQGPHGRVLFRQEVAGIFSSDLQQFATPAVYSTYGSPPPEEIARWPKEMRGEESYGYGVIDNRINNWRLNWAPENP